MPRETSNIDQLFLELSQFTQAESAKEIKLRKQRDEAVALLRAMVDGVEPCMTDHHGDCQEHYGSIEVAPDVWVCAVERARYLIDEINHE